VQFAQKMMLATRDPLVEIALRVGFQCQSHFTTVFRRFVGLAPGRWRIENMEKTWSEGSG
jgi:AraC-like DNA-binding protein